MSMVTLFVCTKKLAVRLGCLTIALVWKAPLAQQERPVPSTDGQPHTLHAYVDLVEVPTMVLGRLYKDVPDLEAAAFSVRLDAGRAFHPLHVRTEGDDLLEIGVLVDAANAGSAQTLASFQEALPQLASESLSTRDRVTVYAVDCGLFRAPQVDVSASKSSLETSLRDVLAHAGLHRSGGAAAGCSNTRRLWDAIGAVAAEIGTRPGRHILLVLTDGVDHGSVNTWEQVRENANDRSVAVFGIREPKALAPVKAQPGASRVNPEDPFELLCAGTGGTVLGISQHGVILSLRRAVMMVRNRYVLYFPRPRNDTAGRHRIDVTVADPTAIVRPTGVAFAPPDKAIQAEPSTVPSDPTRLPELGKRRSLQALPRE